MRRISTLGLIAFLFLGGLIGCTYRLIDFTVISNKNVNLGSNSEAMGERVEGKHQVYWFITIPMGRPNVEEAVDRAIESAGPGYDALIDGVLYQYTRWYVLTGVSGIKVVGTPVKSADLRASVHSNDSDGANFSSLLFHSETGISNQEAIAQLDIVDDESGMTVAR